MLCKFNYRPGCQLGQQFDGGERESKDLISASLLAGIRKGLEEFRQGLSDWTDSDNEKENQDDFEPPRSARNHKTPLFCIREAELCRDGISRRNGKYFDGIYPPKYGKEHEVGSFNFLAVNCCMHETSIALWVRQEAKNFLQKNRKDLGMACHIPPLKKVKKQGEMPLPSLGPIPLKKCRIQGFHPSKKQRNKGKCHYPASVPSHP